MADPLEIHTRPFFSGDGCRAGASGHSVFDRFEAQAERTPGAVALSWADGELTYAELRARAGRLARALRERGAGPETRVAILAARGPEMVAALLGVLAAGAAYLPIDPAYPAERIAYMLADSGARFLLATEPLLSRVPSDAGEVLVLERFLYEGGTGEAAAVQAESLAYVIYTSGSTGKPKGVAVPHGALLNHMLWMQNAFPLAPDDRVLQKTPFGFDASVWEFFAPLMAGARLVLARPGEERDAAALVATLRREGVTVLQVVPSLLGMLAGEPGFAECRALRRVFCGGEALARELADQVRALLPAELVNLYGPTECCIDATFHRVDGGEAGPVPIGRPIHGARAHLLDAALSPAAEGELYIGGSGVARGYLDLAALTAERFIPDFLSGEPGARLYRTGDRARLREDGELEYLGRVDEQVKIRGHRIEPGEVAAALRAHPALRDAAVVARADGAGKRLVAYAIPHGAEPAAGELRGFLRERLPEHMVPSAFVLLDAFPLTPNGKVDRAALPAPRAEGEAERYVAPRTPAEETVAEIWAEVLGAGRVGVEDDFFELGGDSLLATRILVRVRERFQAAVGIGAFFDKPTVAALAERLRDAPAEAGVALCAIPRGGKLPLAAAQEQLWFLHRLHPESRAYSFQSTLELRGKVDVDALRASLAEIVSRHEVFRTTFPEADSEPVQVIHPPFQPELAEVDLRALAPTERAAEASAIVARETRHPFELDRLPLVRWTLMRMEDDHYRLVHVEHHLIHDGWSFQRFLRELIELYTAFAAGRPSPLEPLPLQFADWAQWQRAHAATPAAGRHLEFWRRTLAGAPPLLTLPLDHPRPPVQRFEGAALRIELPRAVVEPLRRLGKREGATLFATMFSAFAVLLHRYSGQDDVVVGTGVADRGRRETEPLIGMLVHLIALRADLSGDPTFAGLLRRVRRMVLEAQDHQEVSFDRVVTAVQPARSLSHNPLCQATFSFNDTPMPELEVPGVDVRVTEGLNNGSSKFDLNVVGIPRRAGSARFSYGWEAGGMTLVWTFDTALFSRATMERMAARYRRLLEAVVAAPEARISALPLLDEDERARVVGAGRGEVISVPREHCFHEKVAEVAARIPGAPAVAGPDGRLTFAELERRANRLAHRLRERGVGPESRVGVMLARSTDLVVALLGVLKAGGAYVPLDPSYPPGRLEYMLRDSGARVLVARGDAPGWGAEAIDVAEAARAGADPGAPRSGVAAENLAYVIYTSGSTGTPKGVGVTHRSLTNLAHALRAAVYEEGRRLRVAMNGSVSFDTSVKQLVQLAFGHELHVVPGETRTDGAAMLAWLRASSIDVLDCTPSQLRELLPGLLEGEHPSRVLLGGEAVDEALWRQLAEAAPGRFFNLYGPTECTVDATAAPVSGGRPTLGRVIPNVRGYVLDGALGLVPEGVAGELFLGGEGVARGYLGDPTRTAGRFLPDPFSGVPGARMYRTGDRARWHAGGELEFLGRVDEQVKIRGFRVEPGEVEAALRASPGVHDAAVVARGEGATQRLVGYVAGNAEPSELKVRLRAQLLEHMVPGLLVMLDRLPRTPSGKVDRRALPEPDAAPTEQGIAPRNEAEAVVAGIWAEVLGVERVGVEDDFFDLGGHSLLAMRVLARVRAATGKDASLRAFLERPTVAGIAAALERRAPAIPQLRRAAPLRADAMTPAALAALLAPPPGHP